MTKPPLTPPPPGQFDKCQTLFLFFKASLSKQYIVSLWKMSSFQFGKCVVLATYRHSPNIIFLISTLDVFYFINIFVYKVSSKTTQCKHDGGTDNQANNLVLALFYMRISVVCFESSFVLFYF